MSVSISTSNSTEIFEELAKKRNAFSNIPDGLIKNNMGKNLHQIKNHPLEIIKRMVFDYFDSLEGYSFQKFENMSPIVSVSENFDDLLIDQSHPSRGKTDTYYVNENEVLRTHTTAHESTLLRQGVLSFLTVGDVYRKDEIDSCHHRVFHQMEGVSIFSPTLTEQNTGGETTDTTDTKQFSGTRRELERVLGGLVNHLFPGREFRFNPDYFPFTTESLEVEVNFGGKWLEILGGGILQDKIINDAKLTGKFWAFGLGLERLAMILFDIPDIRYFWSSHPRFLGQFESGKIVKFQPYSELPTIYNDISFFISNEHVDVIGEAIDEAIGEETDSNKRELKRWMEDNDFYELVRDIGGDWVESVVEMDSFFHPKKKMFSKMFRITYSPNDPSLKDPTDFSNAVTGMQQRIREAVGSKLHVELR